MIHGPHDVTHYIATPTLKTKPKLRDRGDRQSSRVTCALRQSPSGQLLGDWHYFRCDYSNFENTHSAERWAFMEKLSGRNSAKRSWISYRPRGPVQVPRADSQCLGQGQHRPRQRRPKRSCNALEPLFRLAPCPTVHPHLPASRSMYIPTNLQLWRCRP